jgi:membrane protease YdiL (CAAX protease family)
VSGEVAAFFALACAITWLLDLPIALAWARHLEPAPYAITMAGLGAFGPTLAATAIAWPRGELREVFGRWRTAPIWIAVALCIGPALHLVANVIEVLLGGQPAHWFYPPTRPEFIAALFAFSFGEEFGWRGFAYPRLVSRHGLVVGSLILGAVWGLWHFFMLFTPEHGAPSLQLLGTTMLELALYSVVLTWPFERGNRSMAVAIAFHMGGHLDNVTHAPESEVRLRVVRMLVLILAAAVAAMAAAARPVAKPRDA